MQQLRKSTLGVEGAHPLSKWLALQLLVDTSEMQELLQEIEGVRFFQMDRLIGLDEGEMKREQVLHAYRDYVEDLKGGKLPDEKAFREFFQAAWTVNLESLYSMQVDAKRQIIKLCAPVILVQPHKMEYSHFDGKFRSMIMGKESISWGVQISYPQLYQNPKTYEVKKTSTFANFDIFRKIQRWIRYKTQPTTFLVESKKITTPIRLGKKALSWINFHPGLVARRIQVVSRT